MLIQRVERLSQIELPQDAVVIADSGLPAHVLASFEDPILVDAGESLKTLGRLETLASEVLGRRSSRPLTLVAVGGGSVGDAIGFLASVLWRGVDLWHVPTTLLAMVDSAHGGKTAVNLLGAKNQLGTFYVAERVVLVEEILASLPLEMREDGLAELVKGVWLGDAPAMDLLEADGGVGALARGSFDVVGARLMELLERAIAVKLGVVAEDPFEQKGVRTILNLGHTVAHALELACGLSHGQAVSWGLVSALRVSVERGDLAADVAGRLYGQVYPLLRYDAAFSGEGLDEATFVQLLERDKKRVDGRLRSVLLRDAGVPFVTDEVTAGDWYRVFSTSLKAWTTGAACVRLDASSAGKSVVELDIAASKSEMNRLLVIEFLRPGATEIVGHSACDDVWAMMESLARLEGGEKTIDCGLGGTTLRFLLAVAAARVGERTRLYADPRLLDRPHGDLLNVLRAKGAKIERFVDGEYHGFDVRGWDMWPTGFVVAGGQSSQFASALALLSASGRRFWLEVAGELVSEPYFMMTLALLSRAGVEITQAEGRYWFSPTKELEKACTLVASEDASSAAVWSVARYLRPEFDQVLAAPKEALLQSDVAIHGFLELLRAAEISGDEEIEFDLSACPDLGPVLAVAALGSRCAVRIFGASHLRHKESNRIDQLAESFRSVGIEVEPRDDGFFVPAGIQRARNGGRWKSWGDHRLAMAALLLTAGGSELVVEQPWVVAKSYPELWHHARQIGWEIRPALTFVSET